MNARPRWLVETAAIALLAGGELHPQEGPRATERAPRIGVVLSGGGAKGIAHIGVLRVLEAEGIFADVVAGTSMGALIGGLYAIGHTPATLDSIVTGLDWESYFLDEPEHRFLSLDRRFIGVRTIVELPLKDWRVTLPSGVLSGQRISELLARLTWSVQAERDFRKLPRRFTAMATDLETGESVVLDSGSLAHALRASMSIPGLFDPVHVHGRVAIDGGITRNLPAREARALGADILICSDVSDPLFPAASLESLIDVLLQTMTILVNAASEEERRRCDVLIRPSARGLSPADFDEAAEWIARGAEAAAAARDRLRRIAATSSSTRVPPVVSRPVQIAGVAIEGITGDAERYARRRLRLPDRGQVTADQLGAAVQRVYGTELFNRVRYRLEARGSDTLVVLTVEPRQQDHVGVGIRYDDTYNASLLLTTRLRNRLGFGSTSQLDLRLGEQLRLAAEHVNVGIAGSRVAAGAGAAHTRAPIQLYVDGQRLGEARVVVTSATAFAALLRGGAAAAGIEVKGEQATTHLTGSAPSAKERRTYATGALVMRSNTLDRASFPRRGHMFSLRSEYAAGVDPFRQHIGHLLLAAPIAGNVTAQLRATVGSSAPVGSLPLHYLFMLGGAYPSAVFAETQVAFVGLRPQERSGPTVARIGGAVQWELQHNVFATARADVGRVGAALTSDPDAYALGVGFAIGALTPVGPMEVSGGVRPRGGRPRLELSLGYPF